jgi:hypothetical protein
MAAACSALSGANVVDTAELICLAPSWRMMSYAHPSSRRRRGALADSEDWCAIS